MGKRALSDSKFGRWIVHLVLVLLVPVVRHALAHLSTETNLYLYWGTVRTGALYLSLLLAAIYLLMDKLGEVTIENSLNLVVTCQVDQALLAKNFSTILEALKELQHAQSQSDQRMKDLLSSKEKDERASEKQEVLDQPKIEDSKEESKGTKVEDANLTSDIANLTKRVQKNETNIGDNIKDINLINSDLRDAKIDIEELKKRLALNGESSDKTDKENTTGYSVNDIASNMNKELKKTEEDLKNMHDRLTKAEENIVRLDEELRNINKATDHSGSNQKVVASADSGVNGASGASGVSDKQFEELKKDIKDKIDVINKKIQSLQGDSDHHDQEIESLKEAVKNYGEKDNENNEGHEGQEGSQNGSTVDLSDLKKKLDVVDARERKNYNYLEDELNKLKDKLREMKNQKIESKTSIEDLNQKQNRKLTLPREKDDLSDKLNDLILKVSYLEKMLAGSKNSLSDEKNPEKLPTISRPRKRDANFTVYQERGDKDKSGISRRDLAELKSELQSWMKNLLDSLQGREHFESLELKIQEIKMGLERKADGQGTKKGFAFLENKITQLYLFLTEPETEDAMIVRKGFNCLSCSKKVEKLRGKLGPRLNWNNMTQTNYSPPRVGYSKPMGEHSMEKGDDL